MSGMGKKILNSKGISITSALVAMGIASATMLAITTMISASNRHNAFMSHKSDFEDLVYELEDTFKVQADCDAQFQGILVDPNNRTQLDPDASLQLANFLINSKLGKAQTNKIKVNQSFIKLFNQKDATSLTGILTLTAKVVNGQTEVALNSKPLSMPFTIKLDVNNKIENCIAGDYDQLVSSIGGPATSITGKCQDNHYVQGINPDGSLMCTKLQASATIPGQEPVPGWSPQNPGPGCSGTACRTSDFGPCYGTSCSTNGNYCSGTGCRARGPMASCKGVSCCAGPKC